MLKFQKGNELQMLHPSNLVLLKSLLAWWRYNIVRNYLPEFPSFSMSLIFPLACGMFLNSQLKTVYASQYAPISGWHYACDLGVGMCKEPVHGMNCLILQRIPRGNLPGSQSLLICVSLPVYMGMYFSASSKGHIWGQSNITNFFICMCWVLLKFKKNMMQ